jgi:leucyl/phenylalanyl-tRNA--protein transferase
LNQAGHAHSFEAWHNGELAGGIIGIAIGAAFIGESMFYRIPDASKCALVALHAHLIQSGYLIFDAQIQNPHLARFGTIEVERERYLAMLEQAVSKTPASPLAARIVPFGKPF